MLNIQNIDRLDTCVVLVLALMRHDPETFKRGYSFENALLAVADVSPFTRDEIEAFMLTPLAR